MQIIKVKFLKGDQPAGRAYTYYSPVTVKPGDTVQINSGAKGVVVETDVPEAEIEAYRDKVKTIVGLVEEMPEKYSEKEMERNFNMLRGIAASSYLSMVEKKELIDFIAYLEEEHVNGK